MHPPARLLWPRKPHRLTCLSSTHPRNPTDGNELALVPAGRCSLSNHLPVTNRGGLHVGRLPCARNNPRAELRGRHTLLAYILEREPASLLLGPNRPLAMTSSWHFPTNTTIVLATTDNGGGPSPILGVLYQQPLQRASHTR